MENVLNSYAKFTKSAKIRKAEKNPEYYSKNGSSKTANCTEMTRPYNPEDLGLGGLKIAKK